MARMCRFPAFAVGVAVLAGALAQRTWAQEVVGESAWRRGFHGLAAVCDACGMKLVNPETAIADWQAVDPSDKVLLVLGAPNEMLRLDGFLSRGGSVLLAIDENYRINQPGVRFSDRGSTVRFARDAFRGLPDCPVISQFHDDHPVTRGIGDVVANRTAILSLGPVVPRDASVETLAWMPLLHDVRRNQPFLVAVEYESGGRLLLMPDPSVFANQMLVHGDNAQLAWQALRWLQGESMRGTAMMLVDGMPDRPAALDDTEILLPPPTREEILRALGNLPPDVLVEFGNAVATTIEDEGMVNEFLGIATQDVSPIAWRRFLLLTAATVAGVAMWFGFFSRDTLLDRLSPGDAAPGLTRRERRRIATNERARAAHALMDGFLHELTGHGLRGAGQRMRNLRSRGSSRVRQGNPRRQIGRTVRRISNGSARWWKPRRLERLATNVALWRRLREQGELVYDALPQRGQAERHH
jgi:hypothetical protein